MEPKAKRIKLDATKLKATSVDETGGSLLFSRFRQIAMPHRRRNAIIEDMLTQEEVLRLNTLSSKRL